MDKKKIEVLQKLQKMEAFYVLFSRGTNNPFIICDPDTYNDQVWIFEENKDLEEMAKPLIENKNALAAIKVENKSFLHFFTTLISIGVNAVMFVEKERKTEFDLEEIIRKPDYSNLPEKERPLLNPQMQISAIYFMQELRRGVKMEEKSTLKELEEEMLEQVNKLGIGPGGLGGRVTAIGLNIETYPTHIAGLPVAVNICCHVNRHIHRVL